VVIIEGEPAALLYIALQGGGGRRVQWEQTVFAEFCLSNHQTVRGDVFELQRQGFGDPQPRDSEQPEQRTIEEGSQ